MVELFFFILWLGVVIALNLWRAHRGNTFTIGTGFDDAQALLDTPGRRKVEKAIQAVESASPEAEQ